jgi:type IV pilus assembly protein PilY1
MKNLISYLAVIAILLLPLPSHAFDQYAGDTAIYGVSTATVEPNVLIILDNSGSMTDTVITGDAYDPATVYPLTESCQGSDCNTNQVYRWRGVEQHWVNMISDFNSIGCLTAFDAFNTTGTYQGRLQTNGNCAGSSASMAIGNYINWLTQAGGTREKMTVAKEVLTDLISSTSGVKFGVMIFNNVGGGHILGDGDAYGWSSYEGHVKDMDAIYTGTDTNKTALLNSIDNIVPSTWTPLAETLYESMIYFQGANSQFNGNFDYTSPIEYACQNNYIIIITDGMSTEDKHNVLQDLCNNGDCDGDGFEPDDDPAKSYSFQGSDYLDDVAKYIYDNDMLTDDAAVAKTIGKQNIITHTVGFGISGNTSAELLLSETAYNGGGNYYSSGSTAGLSEALRQILASIVEDNTSFVAPVLPVSPENRTYSGTRVYMGFFKPQVDAFWLGNLKKYGLDSSGAVVDKNGDSATNSDGSIRDNAISYWSTSADGGDVDAGGAAALLLTRGSARNLYTYTGTSTDLTNSTNAFIAANAAITFTLLDVADTAAEDNLINYIHGADAYDDDGNGDTTENRIWIMGDVLHSRPTVVHYATYSIADEANCSVNKSVVYVGSNDGMLHAFNDCDGSEAWGFIPEDLLPYLKHLPGSTHSYYVDSSPSIYIYDADNDGNIETGDGDKVILVTGQRRGGGYYYALDVTVPASPVYMWRMSASESPSGTNTDYEELGDTWSEPQIDKVLVDVSGTETTKVVMFIGAGYDNVNEDADTPTTDTEGRGVYVVEIATLDGSGVPSFTNSGYKIWGYTNADSSTLTHSIPSELSVLDIDSNGYADRFYVGDTGGNMWRFDVSSTDTSAWSLKHIFDSNPGADASTGRKIFYRPAVTLEIGYEMLFFGTGDRAHPTVTTEVDRIYAVKDTGQSTAKGEGDLSDATSVNTVNVASTDGWYLKLSTNDGEKVLAQAAVINKVAYYTTYEPDAAEGGDACDTATRGTSRLYSIGYLDAASVYNYNSANDTVDGEGNDVEVLDYTDRSTILGTGIPSGIVMVINPSGISALIGVGGAMVTPEVSDVGGSIPTYWREVR